MKKQALFGIAALFLSAAASAQAYVSVSAGTARLDADCGGVAVCDKSGNAFKLLGGYRFMPNLAAEFGVLSFGKARFADAAGSLTITTTAVGGGIAFRQDLSKDWNFVARLGLASVKTKLEASSTALGSGGDSDNNVLPYLGLGVGYKLSKDVSLDAAWDFSKSKYDKNGTNESGNVNAISVGVTFGF